MACNCATTEQLNKLYEQFGHKLEPTGNETFWFKIKNILTKIGVGFCIILLFPYILGYVLYYAIFGDRRISIAHFFGLREKIVK